jgi:hypothetical protein
MRCSRTPVCFVLALAAAIALCDARLARATADEYLPVDSPLIQELRLLDVLGPAPLRDRIRLPRLNTQPLQLLELQGRGGPLPLDSLPPVYRIGLVRLERALQRDAAPWFATDHRVLSTPRFYQHARDDERFEISSGLAGKWEWDEGDTRLRVGSGWESYVSVGLERWLAHSRITVGRFDNSRRFADPVISGTNLIVLTEETYIAYTGERERWAMQFGLNRWHWGPGEEGSLILSRTAPAVFGLAMRAHLASLRLDLIALSATLEQAGGEQLAAHRIEWQPTDGLRIGVTESALYQWPGWQPLYVLGAIPYVLVQRLHHQKEPDSLGDHRNNILQSFDASWRVAPGTRVYGEFLIDDLHAGSGKNPNKYAFQLGYEGVGALGKGRLSWGGEYTRVTRFVYTSFFGRDHWIQGRSLGFPVSPDSRRFTLRGAWDPDENWQLVARVIHSDKGENDLDEPYFPDSGPVNTAVLEGNIETTRQAEAGIRWWPASGVDVLVTGGYRWVDQPRHRFGVHDESVVVGIELRLMR